LIAVLQNPKEWQIIARTLIWRNSKIRIIIWKYFMLQFTKQCFTSENVKNNIWTRHSGFGNILSYNLLSNAFTLENVKNIWRPSGLKREYLRHLLHGNNTLLFSWRRIYHQDHPPAHGRMQTMAELTKLQLYNGVASGGK
jgi:hypothetical protein